MTTILPAVTSDIDLFSEEVLQEPYLTFKTLRDLGPAVYLTRYEMWFLGRYDQVRAALSDWQTFSSAQGLGLNEIINEAWTNTAISLDPPEHTSGRKVFEDQLGRRYLKPVMDTINRRASECLSVFWS